MRADAFNFHVEPVRTEMTGTQQIPISHVCDSDERKSKGIIVEKNLLQVCYTDNIKPESVIFDESSTEESKSETFHKSINTNKEKYAIDETDHEEHSIADNPVINKKSYLNLFECGKNLLNRLDST